MVKEPPFITADFVTAYPGYYESFHEIVRVLLDHDGKYAPEVVEFAKGEEDRRVKFETSLIGMLEREWRDSPIPSAWHFKRDRSKQVLLSIGKTPPELPFELFFLHVERSHFEKRENIEEFLGILKEYYDILRPACGSVSSYEMRRAFTTGPRNRGYADPHLELALEDIYWANFLGPEYVEMFGAERVFFAPCYRAERLPDGGALLILSESPLDYYRDREGFEKLRFQLRVHLGEEAFEMEHPPAQKKIPKFRYLKEREEVVRKMIARLPYPKGDLLSTVERSRWERWMEENQTLALTLIHEMGQRGISLDQSEKSLEKLDAYLKKLEKAKAKPTVEFLMKVAAYVSQILIKNTGATWSFKDTDDIPSLMIDDNVQITPLARAQKVLLEGETFQPWYEFLTKGLIPRVKSEGNN